MYLKRMHQNCTKTENAKVKPPFKRGRSASSTMTIHMQNEKFSSDHYGECKAEYYKDKSYIRQKSATEPGKWVSIIGRTAALHWIVCQKLIPHVVSGKSNDELYDIRKQLMENVTK